MFPQNTWHMKMIEYNHFICHYYCHFSVYSHILLSSKTWCSGRSLMTSSDSSSKLISCSFPHSVPDLVNHQYGICRMYSEENPQDFRLLIPGLYSCERVMLLLSAEASFKPGGPFFWKFASKHLPQRLILGRPSLAHKGCGYPIFCTELSVGIIGIYGIGSHTSYFYIHQLLLHTDTVLQAYTLIECLEREVLNERYAVYLYIIDLCTELDGLGFLASDDGTYIITVNADDAVTDFPPFKHFLFLYKLLSDDGKTLLVILCISE